METVGDRIRWRRDMLGLSQGALAKKAGIPQQTIGAIESKPIQRPQKAPEIARALEVDLNWLLTGKGAPPAGYSEPVPTQEGDGSMIPIIGVVRAGGLVDFSNPGQLGMVSPPIGGKWKAIQIESDMSISPSYLGGDVLFYPEERFDPGEVTGKECTIASEGNVWVRKLLPGGGAERWHLGSPNAEPMLNRPIDWASPITWVRK